MKYLKPLKRKYHLLLILIVFFTWLIFYLIGLPSDYFMQYNQAEKILISLVGLFAAVPYISLLTITLIPEKPFKTAMWLTLYASILPFLLDYIVVGIYFKTGWGFLSSHWYLTIGYNTVWVIIPPIGLAIEKIKTK